MSDYARLKKLDEESLQKLKEGTGPVDECLCSVFFNPEKKKSIVKSVRKALGFSGQKKHKDDNFNVPVSASNNGKGIYSTKEVVKRVKTCGKCGCDSEKFVLKHSYANIRITTPDISSICPCPSDCMPDKDKLQNNIQVIVERADARGGKMQVSPTQNPDHEILSSSSVATELDGAE